MYQHLKELAEKLHIAVLEKNLRNTPEIKVKSGLCTVKGEKRFIVDKHMPFVEKNELLAACLGKMSHENVYVVPAVREFINKCSWS